MSKFEEFFKFIDQEENKRLFTIAAWVTVIAAFFAGSNYYAKHKEPEVVVNLKPKTEVLDVFEVPGMKRRKVRVSKRGTMLTVQLKSDPWCQEGDFDYISRDITHSASKKLLLSIEPLSPDSGFKGASFPISMSSIRKGSKFNLMVQNTSVPVHLAVYICKDSANTGSCYDKQVFTAEQMHSNYMHSERGGGIPDVPGEPEDKIYYFSYLMLEGDSISVLNNQMVDTGYNDLEDYLQKRGDSNSGAAEARGIVESVNTTLKSKGLDITTPYLEINLPRADTKACKPLKFVQQVGDKFYDLDIQDGKVVGYVGFEKPTGPVDKIEWNGQFAVIKK